MKYPILNVLETGRDMIRAFAGYNHNLSIKDNEFYNMKNLTSTHFPVLSPRVKRGTFAPTQDEDINPLALVAKDELGYIDGRYFVYKGNKVDLRLATWDTMLPKTIITMGAYIIILPDKKYVNTANLDDFGSIEATHSMYSEESATFEMCDIYGNTYKNVIKKETEPDNPADQQYWIDTSVTPYTLKQYSKTSGIWLSIATTYVKITSPELGSRFEQYDGVAIDGILDERLADLNSSLVIWEKGDDYIVVVGFIDEKITQSGEEGRITVTRRMPEMDFICESGNRLWGCRWDVEKNINEIYASKLGDFKNWNCFMGISTDSYAASVGTDGPFTAAVSHLGYPIFFKETCLHKIFGNYPSNFQIQTTSCRGVASGSEKSLAEVNEVLYYKSRNAVCAYDGSLPVEISQALGDQVFSDAVAGGINNKYYISMKDTNNEYHLFVYDTQKRMWHREDNTQVKEFCNCNGELYYIDTNNKIKTVFGSFIKDTEPVKWMAETGVIGTEYPDKKYVSRLLIRMSLEVGAYVSFYIQYDSQDEWIHVSDMTGTNLRSFSVPIRPKRCDHFRVRIEGEGNAKIFSVVKTLEQGSDL